MNLSLQCCRFAGRRHGQVLWPSVSLSSCSLAKCHGVSLGASSHRGTPYRRDIAKEQFQQYWQWSPTLGFKICCIRPASCLCIYFVIDHKPLCTERAACWQFLTGVVRLTLSSVLGLVTSSLQANDSIGAL